MSSLFAVGDWIGGRFEVFEVHTGGMAVVYGVRDHADSRGGGLVGLKTLRQEFLRDAERSHRFRTESLLWAGIEPHRHVVRAHGVEMIDGQPHVRMEWVSGGDLRRWIGTQRLDVPQALRFGVQFCLGLEHALRGGVGCHRDIKPANLLIVTDGSLKITDFGLARLRDDFLAAGLEARDAPIPLSDPDGAVPIVWTDAADCESAGPDRPEPDKKSEDETQLTTDWNAAHDSSTGEAQTLAGALLGTLPYMAPEQFHDSRAVDVRTDVYAFGIVLYEMLAGHRPFKGKSLARIRHAHERFKPRSLAPLVNRRWRRHAEAIDAVVQRCLRKEPDERYATASLLRRDLKALLGKI
jgi:serine/threonine protein kinase